MKNSFIFIIVLLVSPCAGSRGKRSSRSTNVQRSSEQFEEAISWANSLPQDENRFIQVLKGEDGSICNNTRVEVNVQDDEDIQQQEKTETAVAKAVLDKYNADTPFAAAKETATAILQVVAQAVGRVDVVVYSEVSGCWGIGFGRAVARAFANATTTAIANALAQVSGDASVDFNTLTKTSSTNVSEIIDSAAALLASGDGQTSQMIREVTVTAKVDVMTCAIARAYAQIQGNKATGVAVSQLTECKEAEKKPDPNDVTPKDSGDAVSCRCRRSGDQPVFCGAHGINGASDDICYVADPQRCPCANPSAIYPGLAWRYCGKTLGKMQVYLNVQDNKNGIQPTTPGYGFCNLNSQQDAYA